MVVNYPITVGTDRIHLLGNGYAPTLTIRDAEGQIVYSDSLPFLPQDSNMTSLGVVKVPDGLPQQLGLIGFFYPTQDTLPSGAATSIYPDVINPVITLNAFAGDLGIDDGTPVPSTPWKLTNSPSSPAATPDRNPLNSGPVPPVRCPTGGAPSPGRKPTVLR